MAASHLSSPVWHVVAALGLALVAATAGHDGRARAAPDKASGPVRQRDPGGETDRLARPFATLEARDRWLPPERGGTTDPRVQGGPP